MTLNIMQNFNLNKKNTFLFNLKIILNFKKYVICYIKKNIKGMKLKYPSQMKVYCINKELIYYS